MVDIFTTTVCWLSPTEEPTVDILQEIMADVERVAFERTPEILAAIIMRNDLDDICPRARVWWHIRSLELRIKKLSYRINGDKQRSRRNRVPEVSPSKLQSMLLDLNRMLEDGKITLSNLDSCCKCRGCYPQARPPQTRHKVIKTIMVMDCPVEVAVEEEDENFTYPYPTIGDPGPPSE